MKRLKVYATSLTTLMFLVVGISGVMMFFKLFGSSVKELHEVLGLVFVAVVSLHVVANWTLMKKYFTNKIFILLAILVGVVSTFFIVNSGGGENPKMYIIKKVLDMPFENAIKALDMNKTKVINISNKEGFNIDTSKSLMENAKKNKTSPFKILSHFM